MVVKYKKIKFIKRKPLKKKIKKRPPKDIAEELEEVLPQQVIRRRNGDIFIDDNPRRRRLRGRTNPVPLKKRIRIHTGL